MAVTVVVADSPQIQTVPTSFCSQFVTTQSTCGWVVTSILQTKLSASQRSGSFCYSTIIMSVK